MFDIPDTYRVDVKVALKDFIPKDLKPNDKKRIKDAVKSVRLDYQIAGEEIPSVNIVVRSYSFMTLKWLISRMQISLHPLIRTL